MNQIKGAKVPQKQKAIIQKGKVKQNQEFQLFNVLQFPFLTNNQPFIKERFLATTNIISTSETLTLTVTKSAQNSISFQIQGISQSNQPSQQLLDLTSINTSQDYSYTFYSQTVNYLKINLPSVMTQLQTTFSNECIFPLLIVTNDLIPQFNQLSSTSFQFNGNNLLFCYDANSSTYSKTFTYYNSQTFPTMQVQSCSFANSSSKQLRYAVAFCPLFKSSNVVLNLGININMLSTQASQTLTLYQNGSLQTASTQFYLVYGGSMELNLGNSQQPTQVNIPNLNSNIDVHPYVNGVLKQNILTQTSSGLNIQFPIDVVMKVVFKNNDQNQSYNVNVYFSTIQSQTQSSTTTNSTASNTTTALAGSFPTYGIVLISVLGSIIFLLLIGGIIFLVYWFCFRKKQRYQKDQEFAQNIPFGQNQTDTQYNDNYPMQSSELVTSQQPTERLQPIQEIDQKRLPIYQINLNNFQTEVDSERKYILKTTPDVNK